MPFAILCQIKFSVSLCFIYLFYRLLLRGLTFYQPNRWYFLFYCTLSFFIPFINIEPLIKHGPLSGVRIIGYIPLIGNQLPPTLGPLRPNRVVPDDWNPVLAVLTAGSLLLLIRLGIQFFSLRKLKKNAHLINGAGLRIYDVEKKIIPFSFGNAIYINSSQHSGQELENIILHEYVHVRQKHNLDLLLVQLICILNWYNPFAWLIRYAIRQNLEFIADHEALKKGLDRKSYQYHLLKVVGTSQYRIANNFNFSSLKKRIVMMNKSKSARLNLVRFLFALPLIAVLLLAFRDKYATVFHGQNDRFIYVAGIVIDQSTQLPVEGVTCKDTVSGREGISDKHGFYRIPIPLDKDTARISLQFARAGYRQNFLGHVFRVSDLAGHGLIDIVPLVSVKEAMGISFFAPPPGINDFPAEPSYADALKQWQLVRHGREDMDLFFKLQKEHPEVSLFYSSEYKRYQLVIYTNGNIEKYGYPNGPTLEDMEKKFGPLPDLMTKNNLPLPEAYLNKWENIAANATEKFHSPSQDLDKVIFPGDSRVIVIPKQGKAKIYDMDNAVPEERMLFEKLYGSLTGIAPAPDGSSNGFNQGGAYKDWVIDGILFYGFPGVFINRESAVTHFVGSGFLQINPALARGLIIYHDQEYEAPAFYARFGKERLRFSEAFVYENKSAFDRYGNRGRNGVIVIGDGAPVPDSPAAGLHSAE